MIFAVMNMTVLKMGPEKKIRPVQDLNPDLCNTNAVLYQPSQQTN